MNSNDLATINLRDLTDWARTATPVEIDTLRGRLGTEYDKAVRAYGHATQNMKRFERTPRSFEHYKVEQEKAATDRDWWGDLLGALGDEFSRRGGWNRYYLCNSSNDGHVHDSRSCGSLRLRSSLVLLADYSGMDRGEFVELAGEGACTRCFPDAPVGKMNRLAYAERDREAQAKADAAKAAKVAERNAKAIAFDEDGAPTALRLANGERPKTRTSASNAAVAAWSRATMLRANANEKRAEGDASWGEHLDSLADEEMLAFLQVVEAFLALGVDNREELKAKGEKRYAKLGY